MSSCAMIFTARPFQPSISVRSGACGPRTECSIADVSTVNDRGASLIAESSSASTTRRSLGPIIVSIDGLSLVVPLACWSPTGQQPPVQAGREQTDQGAHDE